MTTRALVLLTKYSSKVSIPGDRSPSYAYRWNMSYNRVFDPDGAFTIVAGAAGNGPGTYIRINRDSLVAIQLITSMENNSIYIPNHYIFINNGVASGEWQSLYWAAPSSGSSQNWHVGHGQQLGQDSIGVAMMLYKGILKDGWRVYCGFGGTSTYEPPTTSDAVNLLIYEISDDISAWILPGQNFPPPL